MVRMVPDRTGRFPERPHYKPEELDAECERIAVQFLRTLYGEARFPIGTDDLTKLVERDAEDLDLYADLSHLGPDVEGVTEFRPEEKPTVRVSRTLSNDPRRENRLRTTLTHEYGHVHFHAYLWAMQSAGADLFRPSFCAEPIQCRRETIVDAPVVDWMEWQAGYVCGALLMPLSYVRPLVGSYQERHGVFGPVTVASEHGGALINRLAEAFEVSADAARVRLLRLGYLGTGRGPSLFA